MSLTPEAVKKIAHLARIELSEADVAHYTTQLSSILGFVEQMNAVDTSKVAPLSHSFDMPQRLRADVVDEENQRDKYQQIAPAVMAGLYLVPQVIE